MRYWLRVNSQNRGLFIALTKHRAQSAYRPEVVSQFDGNGCGTSSSCLCLLAFTCRCLRRHMGLQPQMREGPLDHHRFNCARDELEFSAVIRAVFKADLE